MLLVGGVLVLGEQAYGTGRPVPRERLFGAQPVVDNDGVMFWHVAPAEAERASFRLVQEWRPDVIHLHTAWLWPLARAIRKETGTPLIFTVHSLDRAEYEIGALVTAWEIQDDVIAAADRIIVLCRSEQELVQQFCPGAAARARIVGNGITDNALARAAVQTRRQDAPPLVLYTGRFVERKGIRDLLAAIPLVLERAPRTHFVLVGGYGGGAEIERDWLVEALRPYREQVRFTGWLAPDEVAAWYRRADILVVPSWYEPFGMVILEGMLHGLPIAAADVGGPGEILDHGRTGLLFPPKDAAALGQALLQLVEDPTLRWRLGTAAAAEVRRKWLWPHIVEKMRSVYQEAIAAPARTRTHTVGRDQAAA